MITMMNQVIEDGLQMKIHKKVKWAKLIYTI